MEQFTASEVRDEIAGMQCAIDNAGFGSEGRAAFASYAMDNIGKWKRMLRAYADRLEADEKAVPVMVVNHVSSAEHDLPIGMKLYAHPAPSDADRLAEALRRTCRKMKTFSRTGALDGAVAVWVDEIESALAAHSAQAQPPVQSKYAPPYPDQAQDPFWKVPGMVDTRPKAQPAASVTDAMIMRAVKAWTSNGFGNPGQVFSIYSVAKVMLEAALAAQENPNG